MARHTTATSTATVEVESEYRTKIKKKLKSNEKRGLCSQSFHVYLHTTAQRCCCIFNVFHGLRYEHTHTHMRGNWKCKQQVAETCLGGRAMRDREMEWIEVRWGDIRGKNSYLWSISDFRFTTIHFSIINSTSFRAAAAAAEFEEKYIVDDYFICVFKKNETKKGDEPEYEMVTVCVTLSWVPLRRSHRRRSSFQSQNSSSWRRRCCLW